MSVDTSRDQVDRLAHYAAMLGIPLGDEHAALRDHHETVAATLRALLAERDAAYAAGQRDMQERAAADVLEWGRLMTPAGEYVGEDIAADIRALPIKDKPDGG